MSQTILYIAGPMTGYEDYNFPQFAYAEKMLIEAGYAIENPASTGIVDGWLWTDYLRSALTQMLKCDGVALLPAWEASRGARLEVATADALGIVTRPWKLWLPGPHQGRV